VSSPVHHGGTVLQDLETKLAKAVVIGAVTVVVVEVEDVVEVDEVAVVMLQALPMIRQRRWHGRGRMRTRLPVAITTGRLSEGRRWPGLDFRRSR
jgi:hypothetical protein